MATHSSILAWKIPGQRNLACYSEGNPVDEGTKRRGLTPSCIVAKARKFHIQIDKWLVTP